jgi:hypothetical protein
MSQTQHTSAERTGEQARSSAQATQAATASPDQRVELVDNAPDFERRWAEIQAGFVDEPRQAVEQADKLVDEVIRSLTQTFSNERGRLESQWSSGDDVSTDDLRTSLQRYRSFFHRLLSR